MTPYELNLMMKSYSKRKKEEEKSDITLAYLNALWTVQWLGKKSGHPKPLEEILKLDKESKKVMTDNEMLNKVKMLNAIFGGEVKTVKE